MTDIWDEKPPILINAGTHEVGINPRFLDWLDKLRKKYEYHKEQSKERGERVSLLEDIKDSLLHGSVTSASDEK